MFSVWRRGFYCLVNNLDSRILSLDYLDESDSTIFLNVLSIIQLRARTFSRDLFIYWVLQIFSMLE